MQLDVFLGAVLVVVLLLFFCSILQLKIVAKAVRKYYNRSESMGQKEKLIAVLKQEGLL